MASNHRQPSPKNQSQTQAQMQQLPWNQGHFALGGWLAPRHQSRLGGLGAAGRRGLLLAAGLVLASQASARAGSVTAESIWDRANAIQRATSQIPRGATVTGNSCLEVDLRGGSTRYICTVTYSSPPATPAPTPAIAPSAGSNGSSPNAPSAPAP